MAHRDFDEVTPAIIEDKIFGLLAERQEGATICPSEVARALVPVGGAWRPLMTQVRLVAGGLAQAHRLKVTRGGIEVDAVSPGGPIRLGLPVPSNLVAVEPAEEIRRLQGKLDWQGDLDAMRTDK